MADKITEEMRQIQYESVASIAHKSFVAIVEDGADFIIVQHSADGSTWPSTRYSTKRAAASRLLQLLEIGPVAPQTHPERVGISIAEAQP